MAKKPAKKTATKPKATAGATHVCVVLDRSGSMQARRTDALGGVNSYIAAAKKDKALKASRLSLVTFAAAPGIESVQTLRKNEGIADAEPILSEEYRCDGWTPLYDAIGRGIGILDEALAGDKKTGKAVLVVMTDGAENHSKEFNKARITQLIEEKKGAGWMILFLGEGLDVAKQGLDIGTYSANTVALDSSNYRHSGAVLAQSAGRYAAAADGYETMAMAADALTDAEKKLLQTAREVVKRKKAARP